jgi:hypothetical protein
MGKSKRVWIVDADLSAAFDRIGHARLLAALGSFPAPGHDRGLAWRPGTGAISPACAGRFLATPKGCG